MSTRCLTVVRVVGCLAVLGLSAGAFAADQPGTYFKADLNFVQTAGNSQAGNLGAKANFTENWLRSGFTMNAGGVRTQTTETSRTATGTSQQNMTIQETSLSKTSAENYFADAQFSYRITESFYWFTKGSWARDNPAGLTSRFMEMTGFGYNFAKKEGTEFKLNAAATLTEETDKVKNPDPDLKDTYPGVQVSYSYKQKVSSTTTLTHTLVFDLPFSPMDNFRLDGQAGIEVAMNRSGSLGLKLDARVQYRNMPALEEIDLTQPDGTKTKVTNPLHKVDAQLTAALTINLSRKGGMTSVRGH